MKTWRDKDCTVWYRGPERGSVAAVCENLYRMSSGRLEWAAAPGAWQKNGVNEYAERAIAKLWPPPTKAQLWRKVKRLAGELIFGEADAGVFEIDKWANAEPAIRRLLKTAREWASYRPANDKEAKRCAKLITKLEAALADYEAAK